MITLGFVGRGGGITSLESHIICHHSSYEPLQFSGEAQIMLLLLLLTMMMVVLYDILINGPSDPSMLSQLQLCLSTCLNIYRLIF